MGEEKRFSIKLSIKDRSFIDKDIEKKYEQPLYLTSIVLESFHQLLKGEKEVNVLSVKSAIKNICITFDIENDISTICDRCDDDSNYKILFEEIEAISFAIKEWIENKNFKFGNDFFATKTIEHKALIAFQTSLALSPITPMLYGESIGRIHFSDSILPLLWAEIWFEIEMDVQHMKICPHCSTIYITPRNNPDKLNCGSLACKKQHLIDSHGGIEGYRKWERTRKSIKTNYASTFIPNKSVM